MNRSGFSGCTIYVDCSWQPDRAVEIALISYADSAGTNAVRLANGKGGTIYAGNIAGTSTRFFRASFDTSTGLWRSYFFNIEAAVGVVGRVINPAGGAVYEPTGPCTVKEWEDELTRQ